MWLSVTLLCCLGAVSAQGPDAEPQLNTWNSSAKLTKAQIKAAGLNDFTVRTTEVALDWERTNFAGDSVKSSFYHVPKGTAELPPGSVLKKEAHTDTSFYTLPAGLAMSRFLFQSENINGTAVPASAYVLWPYLARRFSGIKGIPMVVWGHGNSGFTSECAPSHIRNLWYDFKGPFELALSGYAVVAPDYQGLGVFKDANGKYIPSQWLAGASQGNDMVHAATAAREAFSQLSQEFVIIGHSQGGAAAWGATQRLAKKPVDGYLGAVAGSPVTRLGDPGQINSPSLFSFLPGLAQSVQGIFPGFKLHDFLTDAGIARLKLITELGGGNAVQGQLFPGVDLANPKYQTQTKYFDEYNRINENGGKAFKGPMLVLQGTSDGAVPAYRTTSAVNATCKAFPDETLEYLQFEGVSHTPVMYVAQSIWLEWISERFRKISPKAGCFQELLKPARPLQDYQAETQFFLESDLYAYESS